jgi:hypothetical protein
MATKVSFKVERTLSKKEQSDRLNKLREIEEEMMVESRKGDLKRARSVTVGTAGGGATELMLRGNDGSILWSIMQPVEVIELIHQLSANVGCHIALKPRDDFSSWRRWQASGDDRMLLSSWPPLAEHTAKVETSGHSEDMNVTNRIGLTSTETQPPVEIPGPATDATPDHVGLAQENLKIRNNNADTMATEENINQRSSKRTTTAS